LWSSEENNIFKKIYYQSRKKKGKFGRGVLWTAAQHGRVAFPWLLLIMPVKNIHLI
jgi:hypothetical protein